MSEWTPEALAEARAQEDAAIAEGWCPWSGESLVSCQHTICDCFLQLREGPAPDFMAEDAKYV